MSTVYPTPAYRTPGLLFAVRAGAERAPGGGGVIREGMGIGSPETVIKNLKMWGEIGVDRMLCIVNTGGQIPQERVLRSLRLFAEQVMPVLSGPERSAGPARGPALDTGTGKSKPKARSRSGRVETERATP
ncbi:MAG: hypothetical protein WD379_10505 [Dehalococcoidia bacterium]